MRSIGILGGTFDPIHNAHLRLAEEGLKQLKLEQVRFIPVNIPPHREMPVASSHHRKIMIQHAINDEAKFSIDNRELERQEVSYSINTLKSLRQEFENDSLCLMLGQDAFNKIDSWKDWSELLNYAHIIVANRPNESTEEQSDELNNWINKKITNHKTELTTRPSGHIYFIDIPDLDISSSMIRKNIKENKTVEDLIPVQIQNYIKDNHLYLDTA